MSAAEGDDGEVLDGRGNIHIEVPPQESFVELDTFSDEMLDEEPELTVMYDADDMNRWIRCESWFVIDLEEVQ